MVVQRNGSVSFQTPDVRNNRASRAPAVWLSAAFQPGKSIERAPWRGCAILSSMFFILLPLGLLFASIAAAQPADLIVENAVIHTMDPAHPEARAVAVRGGRVAALDDAANALAGAQTRRIDARGATLIPGLIDSHGHMQALGDILQTFDLREVQTIAGIARIVHEKAAGRAKAEWIRGRA